VSTPAIIEPVPRACYIVASDGRKIMLSDLSNSAYEAIHDMMIRHKATGTVTLHFKGGRFMEAKAEMSKLYK
jgi:hypothetical protein